MLGSIALSLADKLGGSVEDDHRANRIGVEPTTAEAKGSKPNTFTYFATHNWAMFAV